MAKTKITVELTLKDGSKLVLDKTKIKNIESLSQTNADASTIYYGVLPSSGRLEILDYDGTIKRYIKDGVIDTSSIKVDIYKNGVLNQSHISSNSNYANESSIMTIELTNKLSLWDNINFNGYKYPEKNESAYIILKNIFINTGYSEEQILQMLDGNVASFDGDCISIKDYLERIQIEYPYLSPDTLRATIDKFCTLAQLNVIIDNNGDIKFVSARPIGNIKNIIKIPFNKQYGDFNYSIILKNKYDAIDISEYNAYYSFKDEDNAIRHSVIPNNLKFLYSSYKHYDSYDTDEGTYFDRILKVEGYYYDGEITISENVLSNNKFEKVTNLSGKYTLEDNDYYTSTIFSYSGTVTEETGTILDKRKFIDDINPLDDSYFSMNEYSSNLEFNDIADTTYTKPPVKLEHKKDYSEDIENSEEIPDQSYVKFKYNKEKGEYHIKYHILSRTITYNIQAAYSGIDLYVPLEYEIKRYNTINTTFSIGGQVFYIDFLETSASSNNINIAKNPVKIDTNELLQVTSTINGIKVSEILKSNIINDYYEGISSGTITIAATDYFDNLGNKVVDSSKGETIKISDILYMEGNNKLWKVTGVNGRKAGTPYIDLQVMEFKMSKINTVEKAFNLYKSNIKIYRSHSFNSEALIGEIDSNEVIYKGDILTFNVIPIEGGDIISIKISLNNSGQLIEYENNSEYIANEDFTLEAICYSWETIYESSDELPIQYGSSNIESENIFAFNDITNVIADKKVRFTGNAITQVESGYSITNEGTVFNNFKSDSVRYIYIMDTPYGSGQVIGNIKFSILTPTESSVLKYKNESKTTSSSIADDIAIIKSLKPVKIEQYR